MTRTGLATAAGRPDGRSHRFAGGAVGYHDDSPPEPDAVSLQRRAIGEQRLHRQPYRLPDTLSGGAAIAEVASQQSGYGAAGVQIWLARGAPLAEVVTLRDPTGALLPLAGTLVAAPTTRGAPAVPRPVCTLAL
ncbi:MAG: hypothetical protein R3E31_02610 [Chloroflexota bacterium]